MLSTILTRNNSISEGRKVRTAWDAVRTELTVSRYAVAATTLGLTAAAWFAKTEPQFALLSLGTAALAGGVSAYYGIKATRMMQNIPSSGVPTLTHDL